MEFVLANIQAFISILSIWILAVMMPGPDMFLVIRMAINKGKMAAIMAVFGIVAGTFIWLIVGFFFIAILGGGALFDILKICGGIYLIWMASQVFKSLKKQSVAQDYDTKESGKAAFYTGLLTNIANPKPPIFVSIILSKLPLYTPFLIDCSLLFVMLIIPLVWFYIVVRLFTIEVFLDKFMRHSKVVDILAGIVFGIFGIDLVYEGIRALA